MSTENQILLIIVLLVVLVFALGVNYYIYRRQVAAEQRRIKLRKLQSTLPDLLQCLSVLKQTDCSKPLLSALESYATELFDQLGKLSPNPELLGRLQSQKSSPDSVNVNPRTTDGLQQIQQAANKSVTVLRLLQTKKYITQQQVDAYTQDLQLMRLVYEIENQMFFAQEMLDKDKKSAAKNQLRQAMKMVHKIPTADPRRDKLKDALIAQMNEIDPPAPEAENQASEG